MDKRIAIIAATVLSAAALPVHAACPSGPQMSVRFYDVGQGLAALVTLPDGRHILVDSGPPIAHGLVDSLKRDLNGKPLDLLWITHQHIDHLGGADNILSSVTTLNYIDNGRGVDMPEVVKAIKAASAHGTHVRAFHPGGPNIAPLPSTQAVKIAAVLPKTFPKTCNSDENDCSIGLRIDYCQTSFLFVGDAEGMEENSLSPGGPTTVLQLGHHGSDSSSTDAFLAKVRPKYAVISAGQPGVGANVAYCHPRKSTVERVTKLLGGAGSKTLKSFDGAAKCLGSTPANWYAVPASDRIFATERDGDVLLVTTGKGEIVKSAPGSASSFVLSPDQRLRLDRLAQPISPAAHK